MCKWINTEANMQLKIIVHSQEVSHCEVKDRHKACCVTIHQ